MRWAWIALTMLGAATAVLAWQVGAGTSRYASPDGPTAPPTMTPDNRIETSIALQLTMQPTATSTTRPVPTRRPTMTPLPYCYGEEEPKRWTKCSPQSPTPPVPPTEVVTVVPLTCSTVTAMLDRSPVSVPQSCLWEGR